MHGGSLPKHTASNLEEVRLAYWMMHLENVYRSGSLDKELQEELRKIPAMAIRLQELDNQSAEGSSRAQRAAKRPEELASWTGEHGGSLPKYGTADPVKVSLTVWVNNVGAKFRSGTLALEL